MGYSFSLDDVGFLRSRHGEKALETVSGLALTSSSMLSDITEVRSRYAPHDAALIETVRCRRRATTKLRDPAELLLTDDALQQATASVVAEHRAAEIAGRFPASVVHDMTCSIGAELRELVRASGISGAIGSDLDRVRLAMARHNVPDATLLVADALTPTSSADVLLADPARRSDAGRIFRLDQLTPPLLELLATYAGRVLIVKCAPGLDHQMLRNRFGFDGEVQVTSLDGGVREACLWSGPGIETRRRATVLRTRPDGSVSLFEITDHEDDEVPAGEAGEWIVDPDGAIVRAGLVKHYAHRFGLWQLDPQIAYLTGDSVPAGARGFRVIEQVGVTEKVLRKALAVHDCGPLEILVRGLDVDPDQLRKKLKPKGDRPLSVVLTRIGRKGTAFICEPGVRF
ncbi:MULTISPECIES: THUMP-like domain-containing protein [Gordonia]|uniref:Class I SAM-dependent methyltransferase n=1 Tax=Gordonia amicalis TaxID=89053 RepID=A0ABU4DHR7_9ACTN|nr:MULTISPECIES: SAM-dependent methyltransferase [Gordonia]ATD71621.1 SAM-dependent methyltransferase [Gordonia sp. 1D]MCZ4581122.1 class I SAM-dependent methyltransferase [Gordonia amicalis]MDJ0454791.1 class I SAM-dependent methyltransferase [Gordonia amicalis]MDV6309291.1 class I SAM-dependent methyltransferase [Gordonia amicalis]MDV7078060.1 class I SAM-dependent methyltransferase [Gordonia amicalis]